MSAVEGNSCADKPHVLPSLGPIDKKFEDEFGVQWLKFKESEEDLPIFDLLSLSTNTVSELAVTLGLTSLEDADKTQKLDARLAEIDMLKSEIHSAFKKLAEIWNETFALVRAVAVENQAEIVLHIVQLGDHIGTCGIFLEDSIKSNAKNILLYIIEFITDMMAIPPPEGLFNLIKKAILVTVNSDDSSEPGIENSPTKEESSQVEMNSLPTKEETSPVNDLPDNSQMMDDSPALEEKEDSTSNSNSDSSSSTTSSDSSSSSSSDSSEIFNATCPIFQFIYHSAGILIKMMRLSLHLSTDMKLVKDEELEILKILLAIARSENVQLRAAAGQIK